MAKKNFGGLNSLLKKTTPSKEKTEDAIIKNEIPKSKETNTSKLGTKSGETRATFIVNEQQLELIKALALWDRENIKEIMFNALQDYIDNQDSDKIQKALNLYRKKKS